MTSPTQVGDESDPKRRGPGRPRDAGRDQAILAATMTLLREQGYRGLTIEAVAAAAKVGRPTIYRRWPSKAALVVAALVHTAELGLAVKDTGTLRGDLIAVQRRQVRLMNIAEGRRVTTGLIADLAVDPELAGTYVTQYLAPRREAVFEVLRRAIARGELRSDVDLAFIYDLLMGPLFMRANVWGQQLDMRAAEDTADVVIAAFGTR
jgi:AcrR family transcriptional regulator